MPTVMHYLDLTLPTPAENLAADEALLEAAESGAAGPLLRFWEPRELFVVLGYTNPVAREIDLDACARRGIPILRRATGGGTVLQGPGCLNYALVLPCSTSGPLASITATNTFIMERHAEALSALLGRTVQRQGFTDLTLEDRKFSGNAQRRKQHSLLFHGTFLLDFDLPLIGRVLRFPSRQPAYRQNRSHDAFLTNLAVSAPRVKQALREAWDADSAPLPLPEALIQELVRSRYTRFEWTHKF